MDIREIGCGLDSYGSGYGPIQALEKSVMGLQVP
jgi:hypothetical protein